MGRKIMKGIQFELRRALHSPLFYGMQILTVAVFCVGPLYNQGRFRPDDLDWTMWFALGMTGTTTILPLVVSLLGTVPHASWHRADISSNFLPYSISRTDVRSYAVAKCISVFLLGVLSILGPLLFCLAMCAVVFPSQPTVEEWLPVFLFSKLYLRAPLLYCLVLIGNACLYAGIYSLVGLAISALTSKTYAAFIGPFVLSMALHVIFSVLGRPGLSPLSLMMLEFHASTTALQIYGEALVMAIISICLFVLCRKKNVVLS